MATSGAMNTSNQYIKYTITITQNSQSIENNTSNVTVSVRFYRTNTGYSSFGSGTVYCKIDGTTYSAAVTSSQKITNSGIVLFSKTLIINHSNDGSKTLACSAWINHDVVTSSEQSYSQALTTIARASQPSCRTSPNHTQNVGSFGDTINIYMNRAGSDFDHAVYYSFGSVSWQLIAANVENVITWTIPVSLMNQLPNATQGSGTIYVETYYKGKYVGTKYCGFTATVPASVKPTVSLHGKLDDITGIEDIYGSPVKGLSKIKITPSAAGAYSSKIVSYRIAANGVNYNTAEATTGFLATAGDSVVSVTVTDSRGRTASDSYTMEVQNYAPPAISKFAVERCDKDGSANKRGSFVKATFSAVVFSMNGKNTASYSVKYKKTTDTAWTELETDANGKKPSSLANNFAPTDQSFVFAAVPGKSYDIMISAVDRHNANNPANKSAKAPTAFSVFSWRGFKNSSGNKEDGAGIGKVPEKPNCLQVGWDAEFEKEVYYKGKTLLDFFYPVNSIYISYSHDNPADLFGGTWERIRENFLWATSEQGKIGQTGGESTHTLMVSEMPKHKHSNEKNDSFIVDQTTSVSTSTFGIPFSYFSTGYYAQNEKMTETGGGQAHNNMPPYIQVSIWRRTA